MDLNEDFNVFDLDERIKKLANSNSDVEKISTARLIKDLYIWGKEEAEDLESLERVRKRLGLI